MKILTYDLETQPGLGHIFELWNQNLGIGQLREVSSVISIAAKWYDSKTVMFYSDHHDSHDVMVKAAHTLLSEADAVVTYNGNKFDNKHLNREFLLAGLRPPAPYKSIDLYQTVKKQFNFMSNKLQHVSEQLGSPGKLSTGGFDLWKRCMDDDPKAWALMKRYNKQDVVLTEWLYDQLKPWVVGHPSTALYNSTKGEACPLCNSLDLKREGYAYTNLGKFQRFQCKDCGKWSRSGRALARVDVRPVIA